MIKKEFFHNGNYQLEILNEQDKDVQSNEQGIGKPLIEFCLPFSEMKQIVDGIIEEDNFIYLEYPVNDNYLEIKIPEESKSLQSEKVQMTTTLNLETYEVQHTLNAEFQFNMSQLTIQIFGKVQHFKKALKEFNFLADNEVIQLKFSEAYPHIQFIYGNEKFGRYHSVKFSPDIDELVPRIMTDASAL